MTMVSGPASAGILAVNVVDQANLLINELNKAANVTSAGSNLAQNLQLKAIKRQLSNNKDGTVIHHTINIDKQLEINTEINTEFNWIINEGGGEIVPIPFDLGKVMGGNEVKKYTRYYNTVDAHEKDPLGHFGDQTAFEASRARKAANDALVHAIASDDKALQSEANALKDLAAISNNAKGHGHQLQVANALAGSQINQLMRLRSLTLVSEAARAAEVQAAADRDARAVAVGRRLRKGMDDALEKTKLRSASY
jgi:conjugal transfer/entry exclusion protein